MSEDLPSEVSECLRLLQQGDGSAADRLLPCIYNDLRALAEGMFARQPGDHTLQPTALVHDAFLRLVRTENTDWSSRRHFYNVAAMAMRQLLTDHARRRRAEKRGGGQDRVLLDDRVATDQDRDGIDLIALDEALAQLQELDPRQARVVELRFLAGLSVQETAEILDVSERTVKLDWQMARRWLRLRLDESSRS